ncbi:MAG TPA: flavin oxidoreductase/NADH oxidase, partial [Clostridiales bacterium]|nr:flavin oxidoreductase/NADH oxidase [Clostridiales bacterium]
PRQLMALESTRPGLALLLSTLKHAHRETCGDVDDLLVGLQLTHSGRFCRPNDWGRPEPRILYHHPILDWRVGVNPAEDAAILTDAEIGSIIEAFVRAARVAAEAGFDFVDIKHCHGYLGHEFLSAHTRPGQYGGSFENRTRFLRNIVDRVNKECGRDFLLASRVNLFDGLPLPYGFGVNEQAVWGITPPPWPEGYSCRDARYPVPDGKEPEMLVKMLVDHGVSILNATMGNPYFNPNVNRPFDRGSYTPVENPLMGVERMIQGAAAVKKAFPELIVAGTGYSWLREFAAGVGDACIEDGKVDVMGLGRGAFAYPDFASDILSYGKMKREKCCITCGKCTEIMRAGGSTGCMIHDREVYLPIYQNTVKAKDVSKP